MPETVDLALSGPGKQVSDIIARINGTLDELISERRQWDHLFEDISKYVSPYRGDFSTSSIPGEKRIEKIYDATGPDSKDELSSALYEMMFDPQEQWGFLETFNTELNEKHNVQLFFDDTHIMMFDHTFNSPVTNFQNAIAEWLDDIVSFGTGVMMIEDRPFRPIMYRTFHLGECYLRESDTGFINVNYRQFTKTTQQIIDAWGNFLPDEFKKKYENKPGEHHTIIHAVEPRDSFNVLRDMDSPFPYVSVYSIPKEKIVLSMGGFFEFPYIVGRWKRMANEVYGRSPTMQAMPHIKMVNQMQKTYIQAAQLRTRPPLQVPHEGFILPLRYSPGALNYKKAMSQDDIKPIDTGAQPEVGHQAVELEREQIRRVYKTDLLRLQKQNVEMSATEVVRLTQDMVRNVVPMVGRLQNEGSSKIMVRTYNVLDRRGMLPDKPRELDDQQLRIKYVSSVTRAMKASRLFNFGKALEASSILFQMDPEIVDRIDPDTSIDFIYDSLDVPRKLLVPKDVAQERRQQRRDQVNEQQLVEQQVQQSQVLKNLAPLLQQMASTRGR